MDSRQEVRTRRGVSVWALLALTLVTVATAAWSLRPAVRAQPGDDGTSVELHLPIAMLNLPPADIPAPRTAVPAPTGLATAAATATSSPATPTALACEGLAERVTVTSNDLPASILANDEYHPLPVAPLGAGSSLVAWREQGTPRIRVGHFDEAGELLATPMSFEGQEVHALVAHESGGAMAIVDEDPDIYSPKYCRGPSTPDQALCGKLDLWRFDEAGETLWRSTVTDKQNVDSDGAHFIWWYQHTARLLWTGDAYGLYFRSATSTPRPGVPGEIDIHAGDHFQLLDAAGERLDSAWRWGCSHSWAVQLAFNGRFGSACHGDAYPNAFHVNVFDRQRHSAEANLHEGLDPTQRALGGMVPTTDGFWLLHMARGAQDMELHLAFLDQDGGLASDLTIAEATGLATEYPFRAYLAAYGSDRMLAGWYHQGRLQLAEFDLGSGAVLTTPVAVDARIDNWSEFVSYPNGDVGWAWSPGRTDRLDLVRVRACPIP